MDKYIHPHYNRPHAGREHGMVLFSTMIIMTIVLGMGLTLLNSSLQHFKVISLLEQDYKAIQVAESGLDKAIFCLNKTEGTHCGGTYGSSYTGQTDVALGDSSFTTTVVMAYPDGVITSVGRTPTGRTATISSDITANPVTSAIPLLRAVHTGATGVYMDGGANIVGGVISDGTVICKNTTAEIYGEVSVSKIGGSIDNCSILDHDAYADSILNSVVAGAAYYDEDPAGINGSTIYGFLYWSQPTPTPDDIPGVDLDFWRESAAAGGVVTGDHVPADYSTLGPMKIDGDLIFTNNVHVTISGPVWVTGNIQTDNNAEITLDPAFERFSTVILADDPNGVEGMIRFDPGISIAGTSDPRSFIMFISTNDSLDQNAPAIDLSNNASGALFYTPNGVLRIRNNATAKAVASDYLYMDGNSTVTFDENIWDVLYSRYPVDSPWRLREGRWTKKI